MMEMEGKEESANSSWYRDWMNEHQAQIKDLKYTLHLFRQSKLAMGGFFLVLGVILMSVFAPYLITHDPYALNLPERGLPPSRDHLFGTDSNGMDIYSRCVWGGRIDLSVGFIIVLISTVIGVVVGVTTGYMGGIIDEVFMRITDMFFAIPSLILAMAVSAALGSRSLQTIMFSMLIVSWPGYARLIRGNTLAVREEPYIEAAKSLGASSLYIIFKHVLLNAVAPVLVMATMDLGSIMLLTASLSFIGMGAQPGTPEWGRMIADGRNFMKSSPWMITFPGIFIMISVLGFNLLGDGLRDVLDPRLRR